MQIFLELVLIGKCGTLYQLCKMDKNVLGRQLQQFLSNDFSTAKGRQAAQKNAFALMRLQRYRVFYNCFILPNSLNYFSMLPLLFYVPSPLC